MTDVDAGQRGAIALALALKGRELRRRVLLLLAAVLVAVAGLVVVFLGVSGSSDGTGTEPDVGAIVFGVGVLLMITFGMLVWHARRIRGLVARSQFAPVTLASVRVALGPIRYTVVAMTAGGEPWVFEPVPGRRAHEAVAAGARGWLGNQPIMMDRWTPIFPVVTESGLVLERPAYRRGGTSAKARQAFAAIDVTVRQRTGRIHVVTPWSTGR